MSAPPSGPPPPQVPNGWLARYDDNYKTFYYVNLATGKSQWDKPQSNEQPPPYQQSSHPPPPQQPTPQASQNRGYNPGPYGQNPGYGQPPGPGYGGYGGPQGPGGYPPPGGYGYPPPGQYGYQQPPPQQPQRKSGPGWGGVALGAGAGLLGGALLADAFTPDTVIEENNYYDDNGGDNGGGFDDGGGDF